jgi:hypothetical protein
MMRGEGERKRQGMEILRQSGEKVLSSFPLFL